MIKTFAAAFALTLCAAGRADAQSLDDVHRLFYNARYEEAAALALTLRESGPHDLANDEARTTALLFVLRGLLKGADAHNGENKAEALKRCGRCPEVLAAFTSDLHHGQAIGRAMLKANPKDETALFYLGKLDLNYVWLQLGPLGRRTGWDEYWEARKSLDAVLKRNPKHVRARVARAWIDYIVDTRMPWGTSWLLGGGNKKRAFIVMREAASTEADFFTEVEAEFALWDLHVRERKMTEAVEIARGLAQHFPENRELAKFLQTHDPD
jgi:tetratricopeptide (TPR) repeat protein